MLRAHYDSSGHVCNKNEMCLLVSLCSFVHLSVCNISRTEQNFLKYDIWEFFYDFLTIRFCLKLENNTGNFILRLVCILCDLKHNSLILMRAKNDLNKSPVPTSNLCVCMGNWKIEFDYTFLIDPVWKHGWTASPYSNVCIVPHLLFTSLRGLDFHSFLMITHITVIMRLPFVWISKPMGHNTVIPKNGNRSFNKASWSLHYTATSFQFSL
jgi:hypothetical protein